MLRLGALEASVSDPALRAAAPALAARALGELASERQEHVVGGFAIEQLCAALLADGPEDAPAYVDRLIACGVGVDTIYDAFVPRAAARLGELWLEDRLGFAHVTLGMARLTEVFRRLSPIFLRDRPAQIGVGPFGRQALFALTPGETHALGVVMAADHFQRRGWSVRVELRADAATLERIVRAQPFDLVGLSAGSRRMIPELRRTVGRLRAAARASTRITLGGPLTHLEPGIAGEVGADCAHAAAARAVEDIERRV